MRSIDYDTDKTDPRLVLSDDADNLTFQTIISTGEPPADLDGDEDSIASHMVASYEFLRKKLKEDLKADPFKRLGKWADFQSELKKLDPLFEPYAEKISSLLEEYRSQHGHVYDEATVRKTVSVLELLQQRAFVPYASRLKFRDIAAWRKKTRTPPGFKDDGDGDFFIWADFLTGLQLARSSGGKFSRAILITRDSKIDWSRSGTVHPILVAEVRALLGIHFEIWSDDKLSSEIEKALVG